MEDGRYTLEFMEKVKKVKSAEELQAAARQFGMEITEEQAQAYFGYFHIPSGKQNTEELSDQELENVSGGGCQTSVAGKKYVVVTSMTPCFTGQHEQNFPHEWYAFQSSEICALNSHVTHGQFANPYDPVYTKDNVGLRKLWSSYCCSWGEGGKRVPSCGDCRYLCFKGGLGYCGMS